MSSARTTATILSYEEIARRAPSAFAPMAADNTSDKYQYLSSLPILEGLREGGWEVVHAVEQTIRNKSRAGFQKHVLRFARRQDVEAWNETIAQPVHRIDYAGKGRNHGLRPEIRLENSHDATSAYRLHAGLFRLVCSNALVVSESSLASVAIRHVNFDPAEVIQKALILGEQTPKLFDKVLEWQERTLSPEEQRYLATKAHEFRWEGEPGTVKPEELLKERRYQDRGDDAWKVFNRVQENLTQGGFVGKNALNRWSRVRQVKGIDQNLQLNTSLWSITDHLVRNGVIAG